MALGLSIYFAKREAWFQTWYWDVSVRLGWNKRGQEMRTMGSIRAIGIVLNAYASDYGQLPPPPVPSQSFIPYSERQLHDHMFSRLPPPWPIHPKREIAMLKKYLEPKYIARLPLHDYWGNPLYFDISSDRHHFVIMSLGTDGMPDEDIQEFWDPWQSNRDIVFYDFYFISAPDGVTH